MPWHYHCGACSIRAKLFEHIVSLFQLNNIYFFLEIIHILFDKIKYDVCLEHHLFWPIRIVILRPTIIVNINALISNRTQLKVYFISNRIIFFWRKLSAAWPHINKSSENAGLAIRNLYWFVCAHKQEAVDWHRILRLMFFIYNNFFVRYDRVECTIIINPTQITIMLYRH